MYEIDREILQRADKCDKNFSCLTDPGEPSCKIKSCINNDVHFVDKLNRNCPYYLFFGSGCICLCPVRMEIYNKYGK